MLAMKTEILAKCDGLSAQIIGVEQNLGKQIGDVEQNLGGQRGCSKHVSCRFKNYSDSGNNLTRTDIKTLYDLTTHFTKTCYGRS